MKAFDIKRTVLAALVASLPLACGTSAPMGPSAADATVAALRLAPALPPAAPHHHANLCLATQSQIYIHRGSLPAPTFRDQVLLELLMLGPDGQAVDPQTCRGIAWSFGGEGVGTGVGSGYAAGGILTVNADTRFASVDGPEGDYLIVARAPNGLVASVTIILR